MARVAEQTSANGAQPKEHIMKKQSKNVATKSVVKCVSSEVRDAEYVAIQCAYENIKKNLDWQFSLGTFSSEPAKNKLERDVLVNQAYAAQCGEGQSLEQAVALIIAGSFAPKAPQHEAQAKRLARRIRILSVHKAQEKIAAIQQMLATMASEAEKEIAEYEAGAVSDEEYEAFRSNKRD